MGLFDFFRSRQKRESALPDGSQMSIGEPAKTDAEAAIGQTDLSALGDLDKLGGLGEMIKQAAAQGNLSVEVNEQPMQVMNLHGQGDEIRNAILETLRQHGVDADKGDQVEVTDPDVQQAIFKTLAQHGLDVSQTQGGSPLGAAGLSTGGDSISQLERLQRLREQGVLSAEEFEKQKRKIIGG